MLLIVDGNNVAWAGFYAVGRSMGLDSPERKVRSALIGLTQGTLGLVLRGGEPPANGALRSASSRPITGVAVAFDHGRPLRRREIFPAYQTSREGNVGFVDNESYVLEAIATFSEVARHLPCLVLRGVNTEADDLIAALALAAPGDARIASTDRDFLQLVDKRVSVYSPVKRLVVTVGNFDQATAPTAADGSPAPFPRDRYLDFRVASGDASDDLPGIPGVGALTAARMLARHALDEYLADVHLAESVLGRRNVRLEGAIRTGEAAATVARNRALMDLRLAAGGYSDLSPFATPGTWNEREVCAWLADQRIPSIDTDAVRAAMEAVASSGAGAAGQPGRAS